MLKEMRMRKLEYSDLPLRVAWVNDKRVYRTMHFDVPISIEGTEHWFKANKNNNTRVDLVFEHEGMLCAMGGFTSIDDAPCKKGELYIFVNPQMQGRGLGLLATSCLCEYAFYQLHFKSIYLFTNGDNYVAQHVYERLGFTQCGQIEGGILNADGQIVDRLKYTLEMHRFLPADEQYFKIEDVIIHGQRLHIVRDDVFPIAGGGSKARKSVEYEKWLRDDGYDAIVTCGGIQSNHNRAMALMAARNHWMCHLVCHGDSSRIASEKGNALISQLCGAVMQFVDVSEIAKAMDNAMNRLKAEGRKPYYVHGGGHDMPGGIAYVKAVQSLYRHCSKLRFKPKTIVHASGTGSTQAGILVGLELVGWSDVKVGISVAREQERGRQVVADFANVLAAYYHLDLNFSDRVNFCVDYLSGGYEQSTPEMRLFLADATKHSSLLFDTTYSGKAFYGLFDMINKKLIKDDVLFWHTGGLMNLLS